MAMNIIKGFKRFWLMGGIMKFMEGDYRSVSDLTSMMVKKKSSLI